MTSPTIKQQAQEMAEKLAASIRERVNIALDDDVFDRGCGFEVAVAQSVLQELNLEQLLADREMLDDLIKHSIFAPDVAGGEVALAVGHGIHHKDIQVFRQNIRQAIQTAMKEGEK